MKCQDTILCSLFDGLYQNISTPSGSNGGPLDVYYIAYVLLPEAIVLFLQEDYNLDCETANKNV